MDRFTAVGYQGKRGDNSIVVVKFFTPDSSWTWLATEMRCNIDGKGYKVNPELAGAFHNWKEKLDRSSIEFWGYVLGTDPEWGYFNLEELEHLIGPMGLPIERDLHCGEKTVKEHLRK
jgi:hypothetical protein